jgi:hypothetical protein
LLAHQPEAWRRAVTREELADSIVHGFVIIN